MSGMLGLCLVLSALQDDPVERQVQRLREQLRLNDEQAGKAREIVKRQMEDLKALLDDEQKPRYDEMLRGGRGGGSERGGSSSSGSSRGGWYPSTDELKSRLGLSDEQAGRINEIRDGIREEMRRLFQDRNNRPGPETFEKLRTETTQKLRDVLNEEQKGRFDELLKGFASPFSGQSGRGGSGGSSVDERVNRAMEALKFEKPEEADAVKGLVRKVVELQEKAEQVLRDNRSKMEELTRDTGLSDEAVGDKLDELRKAFKEFERQLVEARAQLSEVVSSRQELELLRRGVLR